MFINTRSGLRTAAHVSYFLGIVSIVLAMSLSLVNFPVAAQTVGAPQLAASGCSGGCTSVSATFTNIGTADMPDAVNYEVLYREDIDGASWDVIGGGSLGPLAVDESQTVSYGPNNVGGFYRFRVDQPDGYSGPSVVYSNPCKFECMLPSPTPFVPTNTPTQTPVTPTSTPVTPTATPVTPTSTPVTPTATFTSTPVGPTPTFTSTPITPTPQEPTVTPENPTETPVTTTTPVTATPQEPTPTPQEPTVTPENPTETPVTTTTPVTATPQEPTPTPQEPTVTPENPTETPVTTTTPVTATPQEPTPTPQEPTVTPENPTETPVTTTTPVTATPQEPTPTPQEPGTTPQEPTKEVTKVPPTKVATLGVPAVVGDPGVLIPVTGGDMTPLSPLQAAQKVAFNLGLGFIGLGFVLQGLRRRF